MTDPRETHIPHLRLFQITHSSFIFEHEFVSMIVLEELSNLLRGRQFREPLGVIFQYVIHL